MSVSVKYNEEQITTALMTLVAWSGNSAATSRALKAERGLSIDGVTLRKWARETYFDRYNELREKYSEQLEASLAHDMRDLVRQATEVQRAALDKAMTRLVSGDDNDPARTAAHAARVAQSMTDKLLSITGRPTSIREDRNLNEIMRSLAARGLIELPPEDVQEVTEAHVALEG